MRSIQKKIAKRVLPWALGKLDRKTIDQFLVSSIPQPPALSLEQNNRVGLENAPLPVMRYPAPYACAIAINNDVDGLSYPVFRAIHDFVNGRGTTPLGEGLGLEMSDSFWVWSNQGSVSLLHGHASQDKLPPSPESEELIALAKAGYLDTLHGFGEWSDDYTLTRDRIHWALDYIAKLGMKPTIYTAHGGYNMRHNVGGPWGYYQEADLPSSPAYCMDLLQDFGFRYYWSDVFYDLEKYGDFQCFETEQKLNQAFRNHTSELAKYHTAPSSEDYARSRNVWNTFEPDLQARLSRELFNTNPVCIPARDGRNIWMFKRFRGHDGPNSGNFIQQVNAERLNQLEASRGAVIIYQHFGVWRAIGMGKGHISQTSFENPANVMDPHTIWAFRELANRQEAGRVWVTTTQRLLHYLWMRDHLQFTVENRHDQILIHLGPIFSPEQPKAITPSLSDLQGFGVLIPSEWPETSFVVDGKTVPAKRQAASSEATGQDSLSLAWQPLHYPFT